MDWFDSFAKFLGTINALNHRIIITGDFNLPKLFSRDDDMDINNNHRFIDSLNDNFLHQINCYPTRNKIF